MNGKTYRLLITKPPRVLIPLMLPLERQDDPRRRIHDRHSIEQAHEHRQGKGGRCGGDELYARTEGMAHERGDCVQPRHVCPDKSSEEGCYDGNGQTTGGREAVVLGDHSFRVCGGIGAIVQASTSPVCSKG